MILCNGKDRVWTTNRHDVCPCTQDKIQKLMKTNQPKNVQKSIRISEDVLKYIEKQEGNGFNEKLCNMVLYFMEHEANIKKKAAAAETEVLSV